MNVIRNVAQALLPAVSALLPTRVPSDNFRPKRRVHRSVDTAGTSACATFTL